MTTDVDANHDIGYVRGVRHRFISTSEGSPSRMFGVTGAGVPWTGFSVAQRPCGSAHFGAKLAPESKVMPLYRPFAFTRKTLYKRAQLQKKSDKTAGQLTCFCMHRPSKIMLITTSIICLNSTAIALQL